MRVFSQLLILLAVICVLKPAPAAAQSVPHLAIATVTAYSSSPRAVTASGIPAFEGVVACPRKYPLGTQVQIDGKVYECLDRLAVRYDDRFDIWKPTSNAARRFGKQRILVITIIPKYALVAGLERPLLFRHLKQRGIKLDERIVHRAMF
jgi:3D (Asp-Asp-Asp) domain-containing protein